MAFEGGPIPLVAVLPQFTGNTVVAQFNSVSPNQITSLVNQVYQGAGQSFIAGQGQAVVTNSTQSFVNVGVSQEINLEVEKTSGLNLGSGQNYLASALSTQVAAYLSLLINANISNSLRSAGQFGPELSSIGTSLITNGFNIVLGGLGFGIFNAGFSSLTFPGAGDEPPADYSGGGSYTLQDIVFSLQPANQGPQSSGLENAINDPKIPTNISYNQFSSVFSLPNYTGIEFDNQQFEKFLDIGINIATDAKQFWTPLGLAPSAGAVAGDSSSMGENSSWTFITAPKDISWETANAANRVSMFGTNNPPMVAGTRGMRDLSIGNALVEGFVRNVTVEDKVRALEDLANYSLNGRDGFVSVPVYQLWAENKSYGGTRDVQTGYFIIKSIRVHELMRDLQGRATRSMVDITLNEVPEYQVNSGRDIASQATGGAKAAPNGGVKDQANQTQGVKSGPGVNNAGAAKAATGRG